MASAIAIEPGEKKQDLPKPVEEEAFTYRLSVAEAEALSVIRGDLAEWLKELLDIDITSETFLGALDNGAHLCQLARLFQKQSDLFRKEGRSLPIDIPSKKVKFFESAQKDSFYARDNAANFISWCKALGLEDAVMFESEGLVLHKSEKEVILCLLEIARKAYKLGLPVPNLIRLEMEMDRESIASSDGGDILDEENLLEDDKKGEKEGNGHMPKPRQHYTRSSNSKNGKVEPQGDKNSEQCCKQKVVSGPEKEGSTEKERNRRGSSTGSDSSPPRKKVRKFQNVTKTDQDVLNMCEECKCEDKISVKRIKSGKFELTLHNKKVVIFVRVLKETIMVRVGGGWDTLHHFLLKHDPCRISLLNHSKDVQKVILKHLKQS